MLDILKFIFSSFWVWLGTALILYTVLHYGVNGLVQTIAAIRGHKPGDL